MILTMLASDRSTVTSLDRARPCIRCKLDTSVTIRPPIPTPVQRVSRNEPRRMFCSYEGVLVRFATEAGLRVTPRLAGLPPGDHGFHVHVNPNCGPGNGPNGQPAAGMAAGGH